MTTNMCGSCEWDVLIADYLKELTAAGYRDATRALRADQLANLARGLDLAPEQVTRDVLVGWLAAQLWATETRRSYLSVCRGFFGWAFDNGRLAHNPAANLAAVKPSQGLPRPIPEDDYAGALSWAPPSVLLMLRLAAEAGLRRGEIARLHSRDVWHDPAGPSLLVHGKGGKDRVIPLPDGLAAALRARPGFTFPSPEGGHVTPEWVGEVCGMALPEGWTLHSLRHRFATVAYARSRDLRAVQLLLGHGSPAVTQRYVAVSGSDLRAAMNAAAQ